MSKISTKAAKFGTFVSPTTGSILYIDPTHEDERHHSPLLDAEEAKEAFQRGLIEDPDGAKTVKEGEGKPFIDPNSVAAVAASRTAEGAEALAEGLGTAGGEGEGEGEGEGDKANAGAAIEGADGLESRQSTAWPDTERVLGGAQGHVQSELNDVAVGQRPIDAEAGDDDDADAPPAPPAPAGGKAAARGGRPPAQKK